MLIKEVELSESVAAELISLSEDWEQENSCYGYRKNDPDEFKGKRIFVATDGDLICGYLFGHNITAGQDTCIYTSPE